MLAKRAGHHGGAEAKPFDDDDSDWYAVSALGLAGCPKEK